MLLILVVIGGAGTSLAIQGMLFASACDASDSDETDEDETATPTAVSVGMLRHRKTERAFPSRSSDTPTRLLKADALSRSAQLTSSPPAGALAGRNRAIFSLR